MAITRAQQAKQMLQNGGRIGFRIGSDEGDVSGRQYDSSSKSVSSTAGQTGRKDPRQFTDTPRERGIERSRQDAQRRADLKNLINTFFN